MPTIFFSLKLCLLYRSGLEEEVTEQDNLLDCLVSWDTDVGMDKTTKEDVASKGKSIRKL